MNLVPSVRMRDPPGLSGSFRLLFICLCANQLSVSHSGEYTLSMDSETTCTKTHYYEVADVFTVSASGLLHNGHCPLTFIQSGAWMNGNAVEPCVSLCVRIVNYSMESCSVKLSYHDGLNDFSPVTFDCRKFPPVLWCSSKNDLKVTMSEMKNYDGKKYAVTLEIKPFCGTYTHPTTDLSVVSQPQVKSNSMSQTAVIIGAVVGTISILFVLGWLMYCYKKRHNQDSDSSDRRPVERNIRSVTPNQQTNRYAPVEMKPPSSQSSSDRGVGGPPYRSDMDRKPQNIPNLGERRLYSPFQPPVPSQRGPGQQQTLYSDFDRGPAGDKWYPMTTMGPSHPDIIPQSVNYSTSSQGPQSQYMNQNQVYKYPQFNNPDTEMHTVPTDTRFVVYDFDYENPAERKYSTGKLRGTPHRESPIRDIDRQRPREITPLRETVRVMPPIDSTTTDHTSDNDSSMSGTTEDETTTDDQMSPARPPYNYKPQYGFYNQSVSRPKDPNSRVVYDPRNFQRMDNRNIGENESSRPDIQSESIDRPCDNKAGFSNFQRQNSIGGALSSSPPKPSFVLSPEEMDPSREGPVPQVPPIPKDFQRSQMKSPTMDLPWPHGPPPPYSPGDRFVV